MCRRNGNALLLQMNDKKLEGIEIVDYICYNDRK